MSFTLKVNVGGFSYRLDYIELVCYFKTRLGRLVIFISRSR